jgi:hypothetical protein
MGTGNVKVAVPFPNCGVNILLSNLHDGLGTAGVPRATGICG